MKITRKHFGTTIISFCIRLILPIILIVFNGLTLEMKGQLLASTSFETFADEVPYTKASWVTDGFTVPWVNGFDANRANTDNAFAKTGTNSLRIKYPVNTFGTSNNGAQAPLMVTPSDELFCSYWVRFSDDFDWGGSSEGGKLPGLAGGGRCSGCATCTGTNGFSARVMWRSGGKAVLYLYHLDKLNPPCGDNITLQVSPGVDFYFQKGRWYNIMQRVKVNTGSNHDGEVELWIDNRPALLKTGIHFVDNGDKVDCLYFSTFHGGSDANWAPSVDCFTWFDDIKIGKTAADVTINTSSDLIAPTAPSALASSNISDISFSLAWTAGTDNVGVTEYEVYLNGVYKTSLTGITGTVTGLTPSTTYEVTLVSKDAAGNSSPVSSSISVTTVAGCGAAVPWTSFPIASQAGVFTAEFDVTLGSNNMDGLVGFSTITPSGTLYSLIACNTLFKVNITARNANAYAAENVLAYTAGTKYHVRMVINVATHKYDVFVTPQGGAEVTIATNYSFRTEQAGVASLDYCSIITKDCSLKLENLVVAGAPISTGLIHNNLTDIRKNIRLYPNPLKQNEYLTIDFGEKILKADINIFDIEGKLIFKYSIENASTINFKTNEVLQKGFYIVKMNDGVSSFNQKLMVK